MNRSLSRLSLVLLALLFTACSTLESLVTPKQVRAERLLEQQQYASVLAMSQQEVEALEARVARAAEPSAELLQRLEQWRALDASARSRANEYQAQAFADLKSMVERNQWLEANALVTRMSELLPASDALDNQLNTFQQRRASYTAALERALVMREIKSLPQTLSLYQRIYQADPDNAAAYERWQQERNKSERVVAAMLEYIEQAKQENEYGLALEYLRIIQRLEDTPDVLEHIKQARRQLAEQQRRRISGQDGEQVLTEKQQQQLNDYGAALTREDWLEARRVLDVMLSERPLDAELLSQNQYLQEVFAGEVASAKEVGERYYSSGRIEEALALWRAVLPMAPNDTQLGANIERAQRILDKLEALKSSQ